MPQFVRYCAVASTSAIFDWIVYSFLVFIGTHYLGAQVFARLGGGLWAFVANKYWSFNKRRSSNVNVEGQRFTVLYFFSYFISLASIWFLVDMLDQNEFIGKFISDTFCFFLNYMVMKVYVFNTQSETPGFLKSFVQSSRKSAKD